MSRPTPIPLLRNFVLMPARRDPKRSQSNSQASLVDVVHVRRVSGRKGPSYTYKAREGPRWTQLWGSAAPKRVLDRLKHVFLGGAHSIGIALVRNGLRNGAAHVHHEAHDGICLIGRKSGDRFGCGM